jgi:hypothetical protein
LYKRPLAKCDVFVDDFMLLSQEFPGNPLLNQRRTLLHNIDKVFRPSDEEDKNVQKEPISTKKLDKVAAAFQDIKRFLGGDEGLLSRSVLLAPQRRDRVIEDILAVRNVKRVSLKSWQSLIGQLRSLVVGLPGALGQFSLMQEALRVQQDGRVRISQKVKIQLDTFLVFLQGHQRPATIEEIVPGDPAFEGACDAAKSGMGGVWFNTDHGESQPLLWRAPFSLTTQARLSSFKNPTGEITNSDLELAGTIIHQSVLGANEDIIGETVHTHCDNTPAVYWRQKGSSTTTKCRADLLRLAALQSRDQRANHRISHIAGSNNQMADDASRLFDLSDTQLLTHFNLTYPQTKPWLLCPPPRALLSNVTSILSGKEWTAESPPSAKTPLAPRGTSGAVSAKASQLIPHSKASLTQSHTSSSSESVSATVAWHPWGSQSALAMLRTPYATWARRSPEWAR